jgi:hypothetical protein
MLPSEKMNLQLLKNIIFVDQSALCKKGHGPFDYGCHNSFAASVARFGKSRLPVNFHPNRGSNCCDMHFVVVELSQDIELRTQNIDIVQKDRAHQSL